MKIAVIGLGAMGYPIARHLKKNHDVIVWNRTPEVAQRHAAEHGSVAAARIEDCATAGVIVTVLPTSREVDAIVDSLAAHLEPDTLWIDATSGNPVESRQTGARLALKGIEFCDAPVSGGTVGAEAGTLSVMAGGSEAVFARMREVASSFASKILHVGPVGAGHAIKVITNTMMAANVWVAAEGVLLARRLGIDPKTALEAANAASSRSNATENLLPLRLVEGKWPLVFKLALHDKDIRIAGSLAHEEHMATPMLALTQHLFTGALRTLGDQADYIEVAKFIASMNGEEW